MRNIISIDVNEDYFDVDVQLCKPNRTPIDNLNSIYNKKLHVKLGNIHEFSFSIPYYVTRNHKRAINPLIDKLKLGFLVHLKFKNHEEYFVIMNESKSLNSSGDTLEYRLKSLAYRLSKFDVRSFEVESYTLSQIMLGTSDVNGLLAETNWTLGYVDTDFDMLYRSYQAHTSTVLQSIFEVAEKFGAMPSFNTVERKVDFIKLESSGINRGFRTKEGVTLESYNVDTTLEDVVTRLKCYGEEGLEFRSLSPNGANYIQDFSYFMYPFECDANYNVLKSSNYMTDDLCVALTKYNKLISTLNGQFNNLIQSKTQKQDEKIQLEQELSNLETQLRQLERELDLINLTYYEQAPSRQDWQNLQVRLNAKEFEITSKLNQISGVKNEIDLIELQILALQSQLLTENNFTERQLDELKDYIFVKDFTDNSIVDEMDLLVAGVKVFNKYREPQVTIKFTLSNFLKDMRFKTDRKKINLGDIATFESKRLGMEVETRITEIEYDLEELKHSITISNDINRTSDEDLLADLLAKVSTASLTLDMNLHAIDLAKHTGTMVDQILNNAFDTGKQMLIGGYENTNEMTERGFYSRSVHNPTMDFLVINGGGLYITRDGARSVEVAINSDGVHARRLVGSLILSNKMMIESLSGIITIEDETITIKDSSLKTMVKLGRYEDPSKPNQMKHGLLINDGAIDLRTSSSNNRGLQLDANGLRTFNNNGVKTFEVNATTGEVTIIGSLNIKSSHDSSRGIVINSNGIRGYMSNGAVAFEIDNYGNAYFAGRLSNATGTLNNVGGSFNGTINSDGVFNGLVTGSLSTQTMNAIQIKAEQIDTNSLRSVTIDVDQLRVNNAKINSLSAISSDLGDITSGNINISEDLSVGNNIYLGKNFDNTVKRIIFNSSARISGGGGSFDADMVVSANVLKLNGTYIEFDCLSLDFSKVQNIIGLN